MNDYKELIKELRAHCICITDGDNCGNCEGLIPEKSYCHLQIELHKNSADAIEQLVKERDALTKCFRITRTDEWLTDHAVFKIDYRDIIDKTADELVYIIALGLARAVRGEVSE